LSRGRSEPRLGPRTNLPPLYTGAFWTACAVHFTGAMSLAMFGLAPLRRRALGRSPLTIGLVRGVGTAASVLTRPFVGVLLDSLGRRPVLLAAGILNAASGLAVPGPAAAGALRFV